MNSQRLIMLLEYSLGITKYVSPLIWVSSVQHETVASAFIEVSMCHIRIILADMLAEILCIIYETSPEALGLRDRRRVAKREVI